MTATEKIQSLVDEAKAIEKRLQALDRDPEAFTFGELREVIATAAREMDSLIGGIMDLDVGDETSTDYQTIRSQHVANMRREA